MIVSLPFVAAACLVAMTFAPTLALAQQARISFSGRIVEPTCSTSDAAVTNIDKLPRHMTCDHAGSSTPSRGYALSVTRLDGNPEDRVLSYFATYVRASNTGPVAPVLLTKVYD
jgi:hypothetical protein